METQTKQQPSHAPSTQHAPRRAIKTRRCILKFAVSEWSLLAAFFVAFPASSASDLFASIENLASVLSSHRQEWEQGKHSVGRPATQSLWAWRSSRKTPSSYLREQDNGNWSLMGCS